MQIKTGLAVVLPSLKNKFFSLFKRSLIIIFFICFIQSIYAQSDPIDTDRPDQTESAFTVPKNWLQMEAGFGFQKNNKSSKEISIPTLLTKYGISHKIELRLITTLISNADISQPSGIEYKTGLEPVEIGAKISLWEEKKWIPKTSLIFHFAIPAFASKANKINSIVPNFRFSLQNSIAKNITVGYNIGAEWDGENTGPTYIYTLSPGFNFAKRWYAYIEAFGGIKKHEPSQHNIDGGLAYYISKNYKIDISSGFGITKAAPDWYVALGFSARFKL